MIAAPASGAAAVSNRKYLLLSLVIVAMTMAAVQDTTVSVSIPRVIVDLHAPLRWVD